MYLKRLEIKGFRSYQEGDILLNKGVSIIVGPNGAGKTSLLEAAQYSLCGCSFRTSRDTEMVKDGEGFFRLGATFERDGVERSRKVSLEAGAPARVDQGGGPRWEPPGTVLCFSPDDLRLIKGAPAERRRFLDEAISRRQASYQRLVRDYQKVLSQRNRFLQRARAGIVRLADVSPWDRQLMALAFQIHECRSKHCLELSPAFTAAYGGIADGGQEPTVAYKSQLEEYLDKVEPEAAAVQSLEELWANDLERGTTSIGVHRDDIEFMLAGKSMRNYGSQGEQRSAVLALLLADAGMGGEGSARPLLLLDDVLSELDPERRSLLLNALGNGINSQVIITAADRNLVPPQELDRASVVEIGQGEIEPEREGSRV